MASELQEFITVSFWGFVETRGGVPQVVEARGNVQDTFAAMDLMERALELGIPAHQVRESSAVLSATDSAGDLEVRPFFLEEVEVRGTDSLFTEAEDLADAVADMLDDWDGFEHGETWLGQSEPLRRVRVALAAHDRRWKIER